MFFSITKITSFSLIVVAFNIGCMKGFSQGVNFTQDTIETLNQQGELFSVRISKGNPVRIFVVGREQAKFDLSKLSLTVRRIKPYPGKILTVNRFNDYFEVNDTKDFKDTTDLEIMTKIENKNEVFKFKLDKYVP